jgi:hypothetical protein
MEGKSDEGHPPWLKAIQNGAIAEARAKAFLLDRFWVLERSADIDGADFIIQCRITGKNLLDRQAPRLGVVQVKFFGTATTTHYVHKEYVVDENGEPREEFFLLAHTGREDQPRSYIIWGRELHENFSTISRNGNDFYAISYSQLRSTGRFEITDPKMTLDRIEHQLELAEFTKNRRFISWALPSASYEINSIEPIYREPIDNWWGDIPEGFLKIKDAARDAMFNVEEIYNLLFQVTEQTDPLAVEEIIDRIAFNYRSGLNSWSISLPDLHDDEFFRVCQVHKKMVEHLRVDGVLDSFLKVRQAIRESVFKFLEPQLPINPNVLHCFSIFYDPETFVIKNIESSLKDAATYLRLSPKLDRFGHVEVDVSRYQAVEKAVPGRIDYYWLPGRYGSLTSDTSTKSYRETDYRFYYDCLDAMFTARYGEAV